ncbi:hypothetical protein CCAX7_007460 [Capsulimonas corticalis]|uniref:3-keto-alpha-glucoside-1,2-lyase/3-keto-2-hydroxy-glucal hydratase domain-containing protein n=1 Tax=Capsulimonas corticalis TaxID=2219043 RepID=A0A402D1N5_9BACT|nr:family 16 glycoside hydrolase [Capsulimonas corticalis]BDI28695.1 hypothetical protein CCAX7_007460 [Capsulimonas corticalis]
MKVRTFTSAALLALACCVCFGGYVARTRANAPGGTLYALRDAQENIAYARVIRLEHSGSRNGVLLSTFERWNNDESPGSFLIQQSRDDGQTWSALGTASDGERGPGHPWPIMWQPFLFELPQALGRYPAGTLLLAGNVGSRGAKDTHFQLWRSADHGAHWDYVSTFQTGGSVNPGRGIWEPFLGLDRQGRLVCYFSDERQFATHSQILAHLVSDDGGDTWGPEVADVASDRQADRPGMATVARLSDGSYLMSYEVCGPPGCEVHVKRSPDGDRWGESPFDLGARPETPDGRYLIGSPYLVRTPGPNREGRLMLAAHSASLTKGGGAPESGQIVLLNSRSGRGAWSWMPAPSRPLYSPSGNANTVYSPCLLPSRDGKSIRLTVPSGGAPLGRESTQAGPTDLLPYRDDFAAGTDAGWIDYGGEWSLSGAAYGSAGAAKAVAGSTGWADYKLDADIKLLSPGQAGLLFRVTDPGAGPDDVHGYAARLSSVGGALTLGEEDRDWKPFASVTLPEGVRIGVWYHITVRASGDSLDASVQRAGERAAEVKVKARDASSPFGAIGLSSWDAQASWRNVKVTK